MNITREDMPGRQIALTIELEPEVVNSALDRAYRQMVNQVNIPGFRRGKAPRGILESYVGREALAERAVKNILPQAVQDAISDQNIEAMDVGDVEIVNMDPLQVKVIIVQPPRVELGDYSSLRVEKEPVELKDEQVEEVLTELRREGVPWAEPTEPRPIKEGDMVYLDLEGYTTAGPLEEAMRENFPTIVGLPRAGVPEVVNQALVGMSVGEEKDIVDTLPDDYPEESLRGKDVTYHVTVRSIKEQQLPEIDDEFAKKLGFETVPEMREAIEKNLRARLESAAEDNQVHAAIEHLVRGATVEVPDKMVDEELDLMLKRLEERLRGQRINLRQYFTYSGITEAEWRETNRKRAHDRLVRGLVLQEFARREGISVDEAEVEGEVGSILERYEDSEEKEKAKSALGSEEIRDELQDRLYQRKILDRLIGIAEGRIEAAAPPVEEATEEEPPAQSAEAAIEGEGEEEAQGTATDLESAGGAAELLGTEGVDTRSPHETGAAEGGGTPSTAPRLDEEVES